MPTSLLAILTCIALSNAFPPSARAAERARFRVAIDPGHGGNDLGTVYGFGSSRVAEKDINLLISIELSRELRAMGIETLLTREQDVEVSLPARSAAANQGKADLFVSIHMNSAEYPRSLEAQGVETYILNTASDATTRRLARFENRGYGTATRTDVPTDVALILKDLRLDANLPASKRLACAIQDRLVPATRRQLGLGRERIWSAGAPRLRPGDRDRGVRQALFFVLLGAEMPSVLVEAGFLTHPNDRALAGSIAGRSAIARAIADAIRDFRRGAREGVGRCKVI